MESNQAEIKKKRQKPISWWLGGIDYTKGPRSECFHRLARRSIVRMDWEEFINRVGEAREDPSERGFQFLEGALRGWKRRPAEALVAMSALFDLAEISHPSAGWWRPLAKIAVGQETLRWKGGGSVPLEAMKVLSASEISAKELFTQAIGECTNSMDAFCLVILAKGSKCLDEEIVLATIKQCERELSGPNPTAAIIVNVLAHIAMERNATSELVKREIIRVWKLKDPENKVPGRHMFWQMLLTQDGLEEDTEWMIQGLINDTPEEALDIIQRMPGQKLAKVKPVDLKKLLCSDQRPIRLGACKIIALLKDSRSKDVF